MLYFLKRVWQDEPAAVRRAHAVLTFAWMLMIPVALLAGWLESIVFISAASIYANAAGHWAAYQAAHLDKKLEDQAD